MIQISPASPIDFDIYVIFSPIFPLYFIRRMHLSSNPRRFHIYVLKLTKKKINDFLLIFLSTYVNMRDNFMLAFHILQKITFRHLQDYSLHNYLAFRHYYLACRHTFLAC